MKGYFITLEGPDGSGKSTITRLLTTYLKEKGYDIVVTREPGGTDISEDIRKIILDNKNVKMSPVTEALLYAASRAQHVYEKILPSIKENKIVICERFVHSSLVYQGIGRELGIENVRKINDFATQGLKPDLTLFFKVNPAKGLNRKRRRNRGDRLEMEDISFHEKVYEGYLELIKMYPDDIKVIDANQSKHYVFQQVKDEIDKLLKDNK